MISNSNALYEVYCSGVFHGSVSACVYAIIPHNNHVSPVVLFIHLIIMLRTTEKYPENNAHVNKPLEVRELNFLFENFDN